MWHSVCVGEGRGGRGGNLFGTALVPAQWKMAKVKILWRPMNYGQSLQSPDISTKTVGKNNNKRIRTDKCNILMKSQYVFSHEGMLL